MEVGGYPISSSILIGFSIINCTVNHPSWGTTILGNPHMVVCFCFSKCNKSSMRSRHAKVHHVLHVVYRGQWWFVYLAYMPWSHRKSNVANCVVSACVCVCIIYIQTYTYVYIVICNWNHLIPVMCMYIYIYQLFSFPSYQHYMRLLLIVCWSFPKNSPWVMGYPAMRPGSRFGQELLLHTSLGRVLRLGEFLWVTYT